MKKHSIGMMLINILAGLTLSFALKDANANGNIVPILTVNLHDNWSGGYFGAYIGAGGGHVHQSVHFNSSTREVFTGEAFVTRIINEASSGKGKGDITGSLADLFIGYNFRLPCNTQYLIGAQLEGTLFSNITLKAIGQETNNRFITQTVVTDIETIVENFSNTETNTFNNSDKLQSMFSFVARAGYLVRPCLLLYGLAGATEGNFVLPSSDEIFGGKRNQWELGYTLGLGLEYRFNDNWSVLAEYRFLHFAYKRNASSFSTETDLTALTTELTEVSSHTKRNTDFDFNLGKIGIVYRFC